MKNLFAGWLLLIASICSAQTWEQMEKVTAAIRGTGDQFGISVALSGDYAIVGSSLEDEDGNESNSLTDAGAAYIYKRDDCDWVLVQKLVASDRGENDLFGESVAMYGDYAMVSALLEDEDETGSNTMDDAGSVYVFKNINGTWNQTQKLVASDRGIMDNFGIRISVSGNDMIVGSYREDEDANGANSVPGAGSAYIFKNINGTWYQSQKIVANVRDANDNFGISVNIAGNMAVVGAYGDQQDVTEANPLLACGSAYIFQNTGGVWSQVQKITHADRNTFDRFGFSVGIGEDHILVGANQEDHDEFGNNFLSSAGAVYAFQNIAGVWTQTQKLLPLDRGAIDFFGNTISISEDYVLISSYRDDEDADEANSLPDAGSAYIFKNTNGTWAQHQKINAADRSAGDFFALRVAMSGDYILVGANTDDEDEAGQNSLANAGSAYFFRNIDGESCEGALDLCEAIDEFITDIQNSSIPNGIQNSLISKLNNARNSFINGQSNAAINKLNAFINEVNAQSGGSIPVAVAEDWIDRAQALIDAIDSGEVECDENNAFATVNPGNMQMDFGQDIDNLVAYPNPGTGNLLLQWNETDDVPTHISIMDMHGNIVIEREIASMRGMNQVRFDLKEQPAGIFIIQRISPGRKAFARWVKSTD